MQYSVRHRNAAFLHHELGVGLVFLRLGDLTCLALKVQCILVNLALLLIVLLRVLEHELHVNHEMINALVLLALQLALQYIHGHGVLDLCMVLGHGCLIRDTLKGADHELVGLVPWLANAFHDGFDTRFHRSINPRRSSALLPRLWVIVLGIVVLGPLATLTLSDGGCGSWTASPLALALVFFIFVLLLVDLELLLVILVILFLFFLWQQGILLWDFAQIWQSRKLFCDDFRVHQPLQLLQDDLLHVQRIHVCLRVLPVVDLGVVGNEGEIAHEFGEVLVFFLRHLRFDGAQGHGLLDDVVVVGYRALVDLALEELRRVVATRMV